jgi:hypothetical protein
LNRSRYTQTRTLTRRRKGREEQGRGGAYLGSLLVIVIAGERLDHRATAQEVNLNRRRGEVSPPRSLHLGLGPKGTRGTAVAPPSSPCRELGSPSFLCFAGSCGHEKRGEDKKRGRGGRAGRICFRAALFFTGSGSHGRLPPLSPRDGKERVKNG